MLKSEAKDPSQPVRHSSLQDILEGICHQHSSSNARRARSTPHSHSLEPRLPDCQPPCSKLCLSKCMGHGGLTHSAHHDLPPQKEYNARLSNSECYLHQICDHKVFLPSQAKDPFQTSLAMTVQGSWIAIAVGESPGDPNLIAKFGTPPPNPQNKIH